MTCSNCGAARGVADRICKKCRFFFEEGRVLELTPPRAADAPTGAGVALARRWAKAERGLRILQGTGSTQIQLHWLAAVLLGLVPGLGHVASGRRMRGLLWLLGLATLLSISILLFSNIFGQTLFALAIAGHAYSIFELTPWQDDPNPVTRIVAILGIQLGLMTLWWPLARRLATAFIEPVRVGYRQNDSAGDVTWGRALTGGSIAFGLTITLLAILWVWQRRQPPRKET